MLITKEAPILTIYGDDKSTVEYELRTHKLVTTDDRLDEYLAGVFRLSVKFVVGAKTVRNLRGSSQITSHFKGSELAGQRPTECSRTKNVTWRMIQNPQFLT